MGECYPQIESCKRYKPENPIRRVVEGLWGDSENGSSLEAQTQLVRPIDSGKVLLQEDQTEDFPIWSCK